MMDRDDVTLVSEDGIYGYMTHATVDRDDSYRIRDRQYITRSD